MNRLKPPPLTLSWTVWALGAVLYLFGFFQRVAPAVMTRELMTDFAIGAAALGNLSAFYYYAYVVMQIPTGILADRWGPRRLLTAGALVAGAGSLLFGLAHGFLWAGIGRMLIGGSVAVAFVGSLKIANHWFPPRLYAMVSGMALLFGTIGAVFAGAPLRVAVTAFGWRPVVVSSAVFAFLICVLTRIMVRNDPAERGYVSYAGSQTQAKSFAGTGILAGLLEVFRYSNTWLLYIIPGGVVGCVLTFGGLWGVPYLTTAYGMPPTRAAALNSALLVTWAIGSPVFGWFSDRVGRRKLPFLIGWAVAVGAWLVIVYLPGLSKGWVAVLLLVAGFFSGSMMTTFAFAKESVPTHLAGTVSGVVNMGVMTGPTILQPLVGWVLDRRWQGEMLEGVRIYSFQAYRAGFTLMVAWAVLALVLLFFTKETYCRQQV
jgi:MFS family permease